VLDDSSHTLIVTVADASTSYWLDYLEYTTVDSAQVSPDSTISLAASASADAAISTTMTSPHHSSPRGTLIGVVLGSIGGSLVVLVMAYLLFIRRERRRRQATRVRDVLDDDSVNGKEAPISGGSTLFPSLRLANSDSAPSSSSLAPEPEPIEINGAAPMPDAQNFSPVNAGEHDQSLSITPFILTQGDPLRRRADKQRSSQQQPVSSTPRVHEDGGVRLAASGESPEELDELPPVYKTYDT
jgi:hypothetical protein